MPMKPEAKQAIADKRGKAVADQLEWQQELADAFNKVRPPGREFELFTDRATGKVAVWEGSSAVAAKSLTPAKALAFMKSLFAKFKG